MDMDEAYDLHIWDQIRDEMEFRDYAKQSSEVVCRGGNHGADPTSTISPANRQCVLCEAQT